VKENNRKATKRSEISLDTGFSRNQGFLAIFYEPTPNSFFSTTKPEYFEKLGTAVALKCQ